jgi:hypothetical protein
MAFKKFGEGKILPSINLKAKTAKPDLWTEEDEAALRAENRDQDAPRQD